MRVGDILEWLAGACFAAAALLQWGAPACLVVAGVILAYEAQCYSSHPVKAPGLPSAVRRASRRLARVRVGGDR